MPFVILCPLWLKPGMCIWCCDFSCCPCDDSGRPTASSRTPVWVLASGLPRSTVNILRGASRLGLVDPQVVRTLKVLHQWEDQSEVKGAKRMTGKGKVNNRERLSFAGGYCSEKGYRMDNCSPRMRKQGSIEETWCKAERFHDKINIKLDSGDPPLAPRA